MSNKGNFGFNGNDLPLRPSVAQTVVEKILKSSPQKTWIRAELIQEVIKIHKQDGGKNGRMIPGNAIKVALKKLKIANKVSGDGKGLWWWKESEPLEKIGKPFIRNDIKPVAKMQNKKVFVVHGWDKFSKAELVAILKGVEIEPIVLSQQADRGMTIIQKFEKYADDVGYAFVLLTPDEIAYAAEEEKKPDLERNKENRARPNAIFELGYFIGKLGRDRVCCLFKGNIILPSDIHGMLYKHYKNNVEEIEAEIYKELKNAGFLFNQQ
jgi:predicted nucleotide-binding protein